MVFDDFVNVVVHALHILVAAYRGEAQLLQGRLHLFCRDAEGTGKLHALIAHIRRKGQGFQQAVPVVNPGPGSSTFEWLFSCVPRLLSGLVKENGFAFPADW